MLMHKIVWHYYIDKVKNQKNLSIEKAIYWYEKAWEAKESLSDQLSNNDN